MWEVFKDFLCGDSIWDTLTGEKEPEKVANQSVGLTEASSQLCHINQQLAEQVKELESLRCEMIKVGEISDFLRSCETVAEAQNIVADLLKSLFLNTSGAVFLLNRSTRLVEMIANWGNNLDSQSIFNPGYCWALRRGCAHQGNKSYPSLYCQHIKQNAEPAATLCMPMIAQGETLGLLYLSFSSPEYLTDEITRLAQTVSQQVGLAFANLQLQEILQNQSCRDPLTGLFNRRYLEESLIRELKRARREGQSVGVIMLDIDYFKNFNDTFGHEAGDVVLREIAILLKTMSRQSDIVCRYGGEELTLILPDASKENTSMKAEQVRIAIRNIRLRYGNYTLSSITASLGVACFPEDGETWDEVIRNADRSLYLAKEQGRDRVVSRDHTH